MSYRVLFLTAPLALTALSAGAEGLCPPGWDESRRVDSTKEIQVHCKRRVVAAVQLAGAIAEPEAEDIPIPFRPRRPEIQHALAAAAFHPMEMLVRLAKQACSAFGAVDQELWNRSYSWFGKGRDFSGEMPSDLFGCERALLSELIEQNKNPTAGPFGADWVNRRAAAYRAPPPAPPPVHDRCEGFWSEGRKWICVEPDD